MGLSNEELEREFYVFYVLTLRDSLDRLSNFAKQTTLTYVHVHGRRVDIPLPPIHCFLYRVDTDSNRAPLTPEFDYWWYMIKKGYFHRDKDARDTTKRQIAQHISIDIEGADWVLDPCVLIKNDNLTFASNFISVLVNHRLSPTSCRQYTHVG